MTDDTNILEAKLFYVRQELDQSFVASIYDRLLDRWQVPTADPVDVLGIAELLRMQIDRGRMKKPETLDGWSVAIADGVAKLKLSDVQ